MATAGSCLDWAVVSAGAARRFAAGDQKRWTEPQAVSLRLGNPGAVTLTVNGKPRAGLGSDPASWLMPAIPSARNGG
jgi:hypothetical protein